MIGGALADELLNHWICQIATGKNGPLVDVVKQVHIGKPSLCRSFYPGILREQAKCGDKMRLVMVLVAALLLSGCKPKPDPLPDYGKLPAGAFVASARNLETRGVLWASESGAGTLFSTDLPSELITASTATILVHGYNTPAAKVAAYFHGLLSYLRDDRGYPSPLVLYDWKSTARHWDEVPFEEQQGYIEFLSTTVGERLGGRIPGLPADLRWENTQYSSDRVNATTSGADGLVRLVQQLARGRREVRIHILAHSMGSQVVLDALSRAADDMVAVTKILLLAPDVDASALQQEKLARINALEALHVFYSRRDEVVATYSRMANLGFPRLGATGPANVEKLPAYVHVHDVGDTLGTSNVHGAYITREGAAALRLDDMLR